VSLLMHAFMNKSLVPSAQLWQKAIDSLGYKFQIDPNLKPNEDTGFRPCNLNGKPSGFEIYYHAAVECENIYKDLKE
jgi:hypothetical protein